MSYYMYVVALNENDFILGILQDLLSCVKGLYGGRFTTPSSEPQNHLWQEDFISMFLVYYMYIYLIIGGRKDHLGVPREGVQSVSLCLT